MLVRAVTFSQWGSFAVKPVSVCQAQEILVWLRKAPAVLGNEREMDVIAGL